MTTALAEVLREVPSRLDNANTLGLPCEVPARFSFGSAADLREALDFCDRQVLEPLVLGEGSNVVLPPSLPRVILQSHDRSVRVLTESEVSVRLRVGAGKNWHGLVQECLAAGWHGLENLALIPGSVGAAPVQNIGAYGVELAGFLVGVQGVETATRRERRLDRAACGFGYRDSVFKGALRDRFVITHVDLELSKIPRLVLDYPALAAKLGSASPTPRDVFHAVVELRSQRLPDPAKQPNAGSFFKNPLVSAAQADALKDRYPQIPVHELGAPGAKLSAAWMIDHCGFKGLRRGAVGVSEDHALVLVNEGGTQRQLLDLAAEIAAAVADRFGVSLEIEPVVYGRD